MLTMNRLFIICLKSLMVFPTRKSLEMPEDYVIPVKISLGSQNKV